MRPLLKLALAGLLTQSMSFAALADFKSTDGLLIMEVESTPSPLGEWQKKKTVTGFTGDCHLEFTGNTPNNGPPVSTLTYSFTVDKDGIYQLWIRGHKRLVDDAGNEARKDQCNDCYIRLEGDYQSGNETPLAILAADTKLYIHGKSAETWDWTAQLDYKIPDTDQHAKTLPMYVLKAGASYTLHISGRSQRFNMDRIVIRHESVPTEKALDPALPESVR